MKMVMHDTSDNDSDINKVSRAVLTEKYPPFLLKDIINKKFEFVANKEYEQAAKYRDLETSFYQNRFGYDIRYKRPSLNFVVKTAEDTEHMETYLTLFKTILTNIETDKQKT